MRLKIGHKIAAGFSGILLLMVALSLVFFHYDNQSFLSVSRESSVILAKEAAMSLNRFLNNKVEFSLYHFNRFFDPSFNTLTPGEAIRGFLDFYEYHHIPSLIQEVVLLDKDNVVLEHYTETDEQSHFPGTPGAFPGTVKIELESLVPSLVERARFFDSRFSYQGQVYIRYNLLDLFQEMKVLFSSLEPMQLKITSSKGGLLFSSEAYSYNAPQADLEYFMKAKTGEPSFVIEKGDRNFLFSWSRFRGEPYTDFDWLIFIYHNVEDFIEGRTSRRNWLISSLVLILFFSFFLAYLIARSITRPIGKLIEQTVIVGERNLSNIVNIKSKDEIGDLAKNLSRMIDQLSAYYNSFQEELDKRLEIEEILGHNIDDLNRSNRELEEALSSLQNREEELKAEEEKFRSLFETMAQGVLFHNPGGEIIAANPAAEKILGMNSDEMMGKTLSDPAWKLLQANETPLERDPVFKDQEVLNLIIGVFNPREKEYRWINLNSFPRLKKGEIFQIYTTFQDITIIKKSRDAFQSALKMNKLIAASSIENIVNYALEEGVRMTNSKIGYFHFVNSREGTIRFTAWSRGTSELCHLPDVVDHYPISEAGIWMDCYYRRKPVIHNDYTSAPGKKGVPFGHVSLVRDLAVPVFDGDHVAAVIGVGNKASEYNQFDVEQLKLVMENAWVIIQRKNAEEALKVAVKEAEQANQTKSEFLANMSHEIRTPLNAVLGFSELLYNQVMDEKQKGFLESIRTAGNSLLTLINDILDLSKIEAGMMALKPGILNLEDLFREIQQIFAALVKDKKLDFFMEIDRELPPALALDEIRLRQVLLNLVGNAIKFTHTGYIKLSARLLERKGEFCSIEINVEDSGIGIPGENMSSIFDSFKQHNSHDRRKYGGTGLGLAICKKLIEAQQGEILVESRLGAGSVFRVHLEKVEVVSIDGHREDIADYQGIRFEKALVMLVDDEPSNREFLMEFLLEAGLDVVEADNGLQAMELLESCSPRLILTDLRMPEMDGYKMSRAIKADPGLNHIPVVAISASVYAISHWEDAGCFDAFVPKPLELSVLFGVIHRFIGTRVSLPEVQEEEGYLPEPLPPESWSGIEEQLIPLIRETTAGAIRMRSVLELSTMMIRQGEKWENNSLLTFGRSLGEYANNFDITNISRMLKDADSFIKQLIR